MEIGVAVVVIVVLFAVLALVGFAAARVHKRKAEKKRLEAAEHRHEAEIRSASAERREAEASERTARARHEEAQAREQAAHAQQDREVAEERRSAADRIDPDMVSRGPDGDRGQDRADSPRDAEPTVRTDCMNRGNGHGAQAAPDPAARTDRTNLDERSPQNVDPAARTDRMNAAGRGEHGPASTTGAGHEEPATQRGVAHEGTGREASGGATPDAGRNVGGGTGPGRANVPEAGRATAEHGGRDGEAGQPANASLPGRHGGEHDRSARDLDPAGQRTVPPSEGEPDPAHDRIRDTDRGPVRAIADRLLGRSR